uniref:Uncharacterized protein n=1 Tax=Anguilla anguilla TaxID=7936 RepID=A0A0E9W7K1_ANGAN
MGSECANSKKTQSNHSWTLQILCQQELECRNEEACWELMIKFKIAYFIGKGSTRHYV